MNINNEFKSLLALVLNGMESHPRGLATREVLAHQTVIPMNHPFVTCAKRNLGNAFRFAEAAWILSGDNRVETIKPYSVAIPRFSDDGIRFFGSYGPKIIDQLTHVVTSLKADEDSRQAVINIWRENPRGTKDVPCTLSLQFVLRSGILHCIATMRSSDAWLGWPYDVFNFSCIAKSVAIELGPKVRLGYLFLTAGSQHLYSTNFDVAEDVVNDFQGQEAPFQFNEIHFHTVTEFVEFLWNSAKEAKAKRS